RVWGPGRGRSAIGITAVAVLIVIPSSLAAWKWFQWTRTDAYQLQRIEAQASALLPELEGIDATYRWIAVMALRTGGGDASTRAREIRNPYYRIQALSLLTATLAKAGATDEAEGARRQLSEVARVLEESTSNIADPLQETTA